MGVVPALITIIVFFRFFVCQIMAPFSSRSYVGIPTLQIKNECCSVLHPLPDLSFWSYDFIQGRI